MVTALGLIPVVVVVTLWLPAVVFHLGLVAVAVAAGWEWARLARLHFPVAYAAIIGASAAAAAGTGGALGLGLACLGIVWWAIAFGLVVRHRAETTGGSRVTRACAGWLVLVPAVAGLAVVHARPGGAALTLALFAVVWAADTGAWLVGRTFGRHRMAPAVSPGKTWEGAGAGLAAGGMVGLVAALWLERPLVPFVSIGVLAVVASIAGDLYESLCKRRAGTKDSGRMLPGHGGILDRIDGLVAAAPVYALATG